jgi:hypothetical protein
MPRRLSRIFFSAGGYCGDLGVFRPTASTEGDDTDDDCLGFAAADSDTCRLKDVNSTTKFELEELEFLEDSRKEMAVHSNYPV